MPTPYSIAIPDERLADIRERVAKFRWEEVPDADGWRSGVGLADLRRLTDYWLARYDWRDREAELNRMPHFLADVDGQQLHFLHIRGDGSRKPLLLAYSAEAGHLFRHEAGHRTDLKSASIPI